MTLIKTTKSVLRLFTITVSMLCVFACGNVNNFGIHANKSLFSVWDGVTRDPPEPIEGSSTDFEINTAAQLAGLAVQTSFPANHTYSLNVNIDLDKHKWTPIGYVETLGIDNSFNGHFKGNGFIIKGLKIPDEEYSGLFGYVKGTTSKNAVIENLNIELAQNSIISTTIFKVGALVGRAAYTNIKNISVRGGDLNIALSNDVRFNAGGIVGFLEYARIENSFSGINVIIENTSTVETAEAGGIVASIHYSTVALCYSTGNITSTGIISVYSGGIVGYSASSDISSCNTEGKITAINKNNIYDNITSGSGASAGGVLGFDGGNSNISSCYALGNITADSIINTVSAGGILGNYYNSVSFSINECAALNTIITVSIANDFNSFAGRVSGRSASHTNNTINNIANKDMIVTKGTTTLTAIDNLNSQDGLGYPLNQLKGGTIYKAAPLNWNPDVWVFPNNGYPKLKWQVQ